MNKKAYSTIDLSARCNAQMGIKMGLFGKKAPCPICGGKIGWLLPSEIEGEYICSDCYSKIDMQSEIEESLTMQQFREYLVFYEQNQLLQEKFVISQRVDFGLWDTKLIFDFENKQFCMSKNPDKTVFEGRQLTSLIIKEDDSLLFKCSADGIKRYQSPIPERTRALAPQLVQYANNKRMMEHMERVNRDEDENRGYIPTVDIPEPFKQFNVELHFNHPYWKIIRCDMDGPTFSNSYPDVNDYLESYKKNIEELEILIKAIKEVAFPQATEQALGDGNASAQVIQPPVDAIEEIKKYKELMEEGVISEEEFQSKKRQLLGI